MADDSSPPDYLLREDSSASDDDDDDDFRARIRYTADFLQPTPPPYPSWEAFTAGSDLARRLAAVQPPPPPVPVTPVTEDNRIRIYLPDGRPIFIFEHELPIYAREIDDYNQRYGHLLPPPKIPREPPRVALDINVRRALAQEQRDRRRAREPSTAISIRAGATHNPIGAQNALQARNAARQERQRLADEAAARPSGGLAQRPGGTTTRPERQDRQPQSAAGSWINLFSFSFEIGDPPARRPRRAPRPSDSARVPSGLGPAPAPTAGTAPRPSSDSRIPAPRAPAPGRPAPGSRLGPRRVTPPSRPSSNRRSPRARK